MKILVSQCLLGSACRWDGKASADLLSWLDQHGFSPDDIVALCPESLGGLPTPRPPVEILAGSGQDVLLAKARVATSTGEDKTAEFVAGARLMQQRAQAMGVAVALLKSKSPSCGVHRIYDGSFSRTLVAGEGVAAAALREAGIPLFDETELDALEAFLSAHATR